MAEHKFYDLKASAKISISAIRIGIAVNCAITALFCFIPGRQPLEALFLLLYPTAGIAIWVAAWLYSAQHNLQALEIPRVAHRDKMFWWWFVPVANLWMPYLMVTDLYKASDPRSGDKWYEQQTPPLMVLWWSLHLLYLFWVTACIMLAFTTLPQISTKLAVATAFALYTTASLSFIPIISSIATNQHAKYHMMFVHKRQSIAEGQPQVAEEGEIIRTPVMEPKVENV
jgi:hypothetical protein